MEWLIGAAFAGALIALFLVVWRRWIAPWRKVEEIVTTIAEGRTPPSYLFGESSRVRTVALQLEEISKRQRELAGRVEQGEFNVRAIFEAVLDGLAVIDANGNVRLVNPAFARLFRRSESAVGTTILEATREPALAELTAETLQAGEPRMRELLIRDGSSEVYLEAASVPLRDAADTTHGAVLLLRDVSRIKATEQVRRDFVANVSHELRTPISILRGYIETLIDEPKQSPEELRRILDVMQRHSTRLTMLTQDILSLARLEAPSATLNLNQLNVREFLQGIVRDWEKRFGGKGLRAQIEAAPDLPLLCADADRLEELLSNLLENAVKFSKPEGLITVRAIAQGDFIRLSVSDEGIGISGRDLPRIFERFYRADPARGREVGGTGLGLSIVKHIAQLHGGAVEASSVPEKGTTITAILPVEGPVAGGGVTQT